METIIPYLTDLNIIELCKNLLFATQYKECKTASELLQKVVKLKCIQESTILSTLHLLSLEQAVLAPSCSTVGDPQLPAAFLSAFFGFPLIIPTNQVISKMSESATPADHPIFFNSLSVVIKNLLAAGVDPIVAEEIALDRLTSPSANPFSFMSRFQSQDKTVLPLDNVTVFFMKSVLKRLHDHESFNSDGAPYPFDVKSAVRYSEHFHSQIPPLREVSPQHVAHETSITFAAMARFMAMHEINIDLRMIFPIETHHLEQHVYYSAFFWTYREAFKNYYYPTMPQPLPSYFQLTKSERQILCRYWNAGNRHVSSTEAMALALRCPSLAPYQVYGFFDRRRRREYNRYRHLKDAETLAKEMTMMLNKLKEIKKHSKPENNEEDNVLLIQREFLTRAERNQLKELWEYGHRNPSRNECELLAAEFQFSSGEQVFAYFEDRRWRQDFEKKKLKASQATSSKRK